MKNSESLRSEEVSPVPGSPFGDSLGGSLFGARMEKLSYYQEHRESELKKKRKDYWSNRAKYQEKNARQYRKHREKRLAWQKKYYQENKDRINQTRRERDKNHPEKRAAIHAAEQAIKKGLIARPDKCSRCGRQCKPEAHHWSYEEEAQLDVEFLCSLCHGEADRERRKIDADLHK